MITLMNLIADSFGSKDMLGKHLLDDTSTNFQPRCQARMMTEISMWNLIAASSMPAHTIISARHRFYNFHGTSWARLSHNQSVYGKVALKRSLFVRMLFPLLFFVADAHLRSLEDVYINGIVAYNRWKTLLRSQQGEWQAHSIIVSHSIGVT